MKTDTDSANWRKKYLETLGSLESERQRFLAMEAALKRVAGRLCTASLGQSPLLDEQIKQLQTAIRRETTSDELDEITRTLTAAIQALDISNAVSAGRPAQPASMPAPVSEATTRPAAGPAATPQPNQLNTAIADDEQVRAILAALLAELRRDGELIGKVDALDTKLATAMIGEQLPGILSSMTDLVGQRIKRIERAKQEIETLLSSMVGKLDEIGQFVADQNQSQHQSQASSDTLNIQLVGEMKAMGESVESAGDIQQIRTQVRSRMDSIDRHLHEFRQRETELASATRARNEQMRSRITQLETEANRLHSQLKDEQRLSTIDVLTKIPNRLAYEKRVEEEWKRWHRFKQPTCIAVLDVDHFKRINDGYGHSAGDRVLRAMAESLSARIRATDFLARYGGEEFVIILPGTALDVATRLIEEMRMEISKIGFRARDQVLSITISGGITALRAGDSSSDAFDRADRALYQAKKDGRNRNVSV